MKPLIESVQKGVLGAWCGACLMALAASLYEATQQAPSGTTWASIWGAGLSLWYVVAAVCALLIGVSIGITRSPRLIPRFIEERGRFHVALWLGAGLLVSYGAYATLRHAQAAFASEPVRAIFLGLALPLGFYAVLIGSSFLQKTWTPQRGLPAVLEAVLPAALVLAGCAWLASFFVMEPEVYANLSPQATLAPVLVAMSAALGASVWRMTSWKAWLVAALLLLPLPWGIYARSTAESETLEKLAMMPNTTALLHDTFSPKQEVVLELEVASGTASCFPDRPASFEVEEVDPKEAPDIVFVTLDAWRWDHTIWSGYKRETNPVTRDFAKKGALFSRAYTPATSTRQTFGSYFTGVHPSQHKRPPTKKWALALDKDQETLASTLNKAGYHTVAVNKAKPIFPVKAHALKGFDEVDNYPRMRVGEAGFAVPYHIDRIIAHLSDPDTLDEPKFVWTHLMPMHQTYKPGPKPYKKFGSKNVDTYDSAMHSTDRELERLFDFALGRQRKKKTYIILSADHGHAFNEHGKRFHGHTTYEEETHVPLIIIGPEVEPAIIDAPINVLAIHATILDIAGVKVPAHLCEPSLFPSLRKKGPALAKDRPVYIEVLPDDSSKSFMIAFIVGDTKLIIKPTTKGKELYDLKQDPKEKKNLATSQPERLEKMLAALRAYQKERGIDPGQFGL